MKDWLEAIPQIDLVLAVAVLVAAAAAEVLRRRGGRYRGLPGWVGFWVAFAVLLVGLSRSGRWAFPLLGVMMFIALRTYFSIVPLRPRDRYAILASYLAIPLALYPGFAGSTETFEATVPILVFLVFPGLLAVGRTGEGLLESMGRILLGVLLFVFCAAHLGLLAGREGHGLLELYGLLVLASELPQRVTGRLRPGSGWTLPGLGVAASLVLAIGLGFWIGPWCGLVEEDAARAGFLVAVAVSTGALVTDAVMRDLALGSSALRVGRAAFLERSIPALYAAPVYFHYIHHFA